MTRTVRPLEPILKKTCKTSKFLKNAGQLCQEDVMAESCRMAESLVDSVPELCRVYAKRLQESSCLRPSRSPPASSSTSPAPKLPGLSRYVALAQRTLGRVFKRGV
ncbi:hypothetical protein BaRGS_00033627 [Batillaria attramentaria]|uniref:Uncharacterized protein n=1 Tax=Batillaria attramentaria TaxID=370345 RepID=A0ABD0JKE0_9CAEN